MLVFNKYFYKKKKPKLYFGERDAVINHFIYQIGGSTVAEHPALRSPLICYSLVTGPSPPIPAAAAATWRA
jgi:hypothetical protein